MKKITGQVVIRETSVQSPLNDGRKLVMIVGVIAIPADSDLKGEHIYPVFGDKSNVVRIAEEQGQKLNANVSGHTCDGLLTSPIWRV